MRTPVRSIQENTLMDMVAQRRSMLSPLLLVSGCILATLNTHTRTVMVAAAESASPSPSRTYMHFYGIVAVVVVVRLVDMEAERT